MFFVNNNYYTLFFILKKVQINIILFMFFNTLKTSNIALSYTLLTNNRMCFYSANIFLLNLST